MSERQARPPGPGDAARPRPDGPSRAPDGPKPAPGDPDRHSIDRLLLYIARQIATDLRREGLPPGKGD